MSNDNVFEFNNPGVSIAVRDALTGVLREGARELLAQAVEAEVAEFLGQYRSEQDKAGDLAWGLRGRSSKVQRVIAPLP